MAGRVVCRIDLGQLAENFAYLRKCAGNCKLMPVLKYDAYGLGAVKIGSCLKHHGAARFAVADINEALEIKTLGLDVQILGLLPDDEIPEAVANDIISPVSDMTVARKISQEALRQKRQVRVAVKLDTGMGRLGFIPENAAENIKELLALPGLTADGLYAHFSTAALPDLEYADFQLSRFKKVLSRLSADGIKFPFIHHAAGDAIVKVPEATKAPFNLARPGGMMYGEDFSSPCRQIISLITKVGALRTIDAGRSVGYFRTYTAEKKRKTAVLEAGYADGIPLALSNRGAVLIRGHRCPILGRISMDYTVVDVSDVPEISVGDEAVLVGIQGSESITVNEWGKLRQTHAHDIWCSIGHRVVREYQE